MEVINIMENNVVIGEMLKNCPYDILKRWEIKEYEKDQVICYQNNVYEYFYIIIEGYANICLTAENGRKYSQSIYKKGDYFGELEIFDKKPYICSVEALTKLRVLRIHRKGFLNWIERDHHFLLYITQTLCQSFYKLSKAAGENTLYSLKYRICNYLIYRLDFGRKKVLGIEIKVNKEQLSEQFAVTQRSINRVLKELKEKRIIEVESNHITIIDLEGLLKEEELSRNQ